MKCEISIKNIQNAPTENDSVKFHFKSHDHNIAIMNSLSLYLNRVK